MSIAWVPCQPRCFIVQAHHGARGQSWHRPTPRTNGSLLIRWPHRRRDRCSIRPIIRMWSGTSPMRNRRMFGEPSQARWPPHPSGKRHHRQNGDGACNARPICSSLKCRLCSACWYAKRGNHFPPRSPKCAKRSTSCAITQHRPLEHFQMIRTAPSDRSCASAHGISLWRFSRGRSQPRSQAATLSWPNPPSKPA